jgi:hypothetical protein
VQRTIKYQMEAEATRKLLTDKAVVKYEMDPEVQFVGEKKHNPENTEFEDDAGFEASMQAATGILDEGGNGDNGSGQAPKGELGDTCGMIASSDDDDDDVIFTNSGKQDCVTLAGFSGGPVL